MVSARLILPAAALFAAGLSAQEARPIASPDPTVSGTVKDAGGTPIPEVEVGIVAGDRLQQFVITGADGKFLISGVKAGVVPVRFRRLGYEMQTMEIDARNPASSGMEVILRTAPGELEDVMISANDQARLREFYEHKAQRSSYGKFYEQAEIRRRGVMYTSELFRSMPGVSIKNSGGGGNSIRIRGCQPMVWVDAQRIPNAELDEVASPGDIAGIEFYSSMAGTPAQYMDRSNRACGTVLVWTRNR
jgi:hypothetical protein